MINLHINNKPSFMSVRDYQWNGDWEDQHSVFTPDPIPGEETFAVLEDCADTNVW